MVPYFLVRKIKTREVSVAQEPKSVYYHTIAGFPFMWSGVSFPKVNSRTLPFLWLSSFRIEMILSTNMFSFSFTLHSELARWRSLCGSTVAYLWKKALATVRFFLTLADSASRGLGNNYATSGYPVFQHILFCRYRRHYTKHYLEQFHRKARQTQQREPQIGWNFWSLCKFATSPVS